MTDYPMIYSAPMVRALLAGIKTQTRRIITPGNSLFNGVKLSAFHKRQEWDWKGAWVDGGPSPMGNPGPYLKLPWRAGDDDIFEGSAHRNYPVIQPGDRLWVKEAVAWVSGWGWRYRADNDDLSEKREQGEVGRWRSPIHMPRWASRLTLTAIDVRPQRLSEISLGDCYAEGCTVGQTEANSGALPVGWTGPWHEYRSLWNSLHGPDAWDANPWVWVKTFDVHLRNIDSISGGGNG
jgi:hypothetical protein